jgi:nucleotide-binding universal stress UspA family protein
MSIPTTDTLWADEREKRAQDARERFTRTCMGSGIPFRGATEEAGPLPSASWREAEGVYQRVAVERVAAFDLMIAASAAVVELLKDIAEASLLQMQRPVLLAPARLEHDVTALAMIAWDESPQCWHAVSAAVPFLQKARSVEVISVDKDADGRHASQAEALAYLRCHGVGASARVIAPQAPSIGETLLAEAAENRAGLLVMGAYSHSRLREMLLGGATRHVLRNATAVPVLMAH